jgi:hypothetical protein
MVRKFAEDRGGKLLSIVYINMLHSMDWECSKGHRFTTTFNHIKNRGQWCPICGQEKGYKSMCVSIGTQEVRDKISQGHLRRLHKDNKFTGKTQRKLAAWVREHTTGLLRRPSKHKSILKYIGCTIQEFKVHLQSKFLPGMTWHNRGFYGWHIDHIIPLSNFDLSDESYLAAACHYTNLQPLWAVDNGRKGAKVLENYVSIIEEEKPDIEENLNECRKVDEATNE